jgi:hypothetical protein
MGTNYSHSLGLSISALRRFFTATLIFTFVIAPAQPAFAAFGDGTPIIANANVFGGELDDIKVDGSSGAFTQKIQIDASPGRNGLPNLRSASNLSTASMTLRTQWRLSFTPTRCRRNLP